MSIYTFFFPHVIPASQAYYIAKWRNAPPPKICSQRDSDVEVIKAFATHKAEPGDQDFLVVRGPQGIGKSTVLATALTGLPCFQQDLIKVGTDMNMIVDLVLKAIAGHTVAPDEDLSSAAKRVIACYKYLFPNKPPYLVVMQANQTNIGDKPSDILQAARKLTEAYDLRVIIDCSDNSLPEKITGREDNFELLPMTDELMKKLSTFTELIKELEKYQALDVVLAVCAGRPILLKKLKAKLEKIHSEFKLFLIYLLVM
jgi:hypothetical protein